MSHQLINLLLLTFAICCFSCSEKATKKEPISPEVKAIIPVEKKREIITLNEVQTSDFDTSFPVINLDVDINEFNKMYENPSEEIEIEGDFNLYRNNELLIDAEKVDIEIKGGISATFSLKSLGIKFDKTFKNIIF